MPGRRLIVVIPNLEVGGTERQVILFAQGLARIAPRLADETVVVTLTGGGELLSDLPRPIAHISIEGGGMLDPLTVLRLRALIKEARPEVVYSLLVPANISSAGATMGTSARLYWGHRSQSLSTGSGAFRTFAAKAVLRGLRYACSGAIANSTASAGFLRSLGFSESSVRVIPNAVDTLRFFPDPSLGAQQRQRMGMTLDDTIILAVGRLVADKDYPTLLRAFQLVLRSDPSAHLLILGRGESTYRGSLERLASALRISERVTLWGEVSVVEAFYNAADLVVQSSTNEGGSNVLREALACGRPCVATDVGDALELGGDIRIVPQRDHVALAEAITTRLRCEPGRAVDPPAFSTPERLAAETLQWLDLH